ncbi:MAG: pyridoxamine 5'-phosphate oxidase family protein [Actinomycetota bacterium]
MANEEARPMTELSVAAPAFVEIAHKIVWATVATVDPSGAPRTRVLHPIWEWDGSTLTGWVATSPLSPKAKHLAHDARVSVTYWDQGHDTCTADCVAIWELDEVSRRAGWDRFASAPEPVGYDPTIIPGWTDPMADAFGIVRLEPTALRVQPVAVMTGQGGSVSTWRA